ncbi:hypothetical protein [Streptomyces albidoflavus]|uniref:hypothetical protein n=1 Tax=Streptomyces albidoflavus TaxID=1886 RepID=UPI002FFA992A
MVVLGPGEVDVEGGGRLLGGGGGAVGGEFPEAFGGVAPLAEHHVEPAGEGGGRARPAVVRGGGGGVQRAGGGRLGTGRRRALVRGEVLEQGVDHVPGRQFAPREAGPHAVGVAFQEDGQPPGPPVEAGREPGQEPREVDRRARELCHCHRCPPPTDRRPGAGAPGGVPQVR